MSTAAQAVLPALGLQILQVLLEHCNPTTTPPHPSPDTVPGYCGDTTLALCSSVVNKTDGHKKAFWHYTYVHTNAWNKMYEQIY